MSREYDPRDWYWLDAERGLAYSSRRQAEVEPFDGGYQDFIADGTNPTRHPGDAELAAVLRPYGLALKAEDQAAFETDRAMGEIARSPVLAAMFEMLIPGQQLELRARVEATLAAARTVEAERRAADNAKLAEAREKVRREQEEMRAAVVKGRSR